MSKIITYISYIVNQHGKREKICGLYAQRKVPELCRSKPYCPSSAPGCQAERQSDPLGSDQPSDLIRRCMGCRQQERRNRKIYRVPGKRRLIQNKCRPLASGRGLHFYLEKQRRKVLQRIWVLPSPLKTP